MDELTFFYGVQIFQEGFNFVCIIHLQNHELLVVIEIGHHLGWSFSLLLYAELLVSLVQCVGLDEVCVAAVL